MRESVYTPLPSTLHLPLFMASILSVTGLVWIMQWSPALAWSTMCVCKLTWKREGNGSHEWSNPSWNKNSGNAEAETVVCYKLVIQMSLNSELIHFPQHVKLCDICKRLLLLSSVSMFNIVYKRAFFFLGCFSIGSSDSVERCFILIGLTWVITKTR